MTWWCVNVCVCVSRPGQVPWRAAVRSERGAPAGHGGDEEAARRADPVAHGKSHRANLSSWCPGLFRLLSLLLLWWWLWLWLFMSIVFPGFLVHMWRPGLVVLHADGNKIMQPAILPSYLPWDTHTHTLTDIYTHMHTHTYTHACTCTHIHTHTPSPLPPITHTHTHTHHHACTHAHTHTHTHTTHTCSHIHHPPPPNTCIHTHTHTDTHTHKICVFAFVCVRTHAFVCTHKLYVYV